MQNKTIGTKLATLVLSGFIFVHLFLATTPIFAQYGITNGWNGGTGATPTYQTTPPPITPGSAVSQYVPVALPAGGTGVSGSGAAGVRTTNASLLNSITGDKKQCPYVDKGLYKPFSNISTDFALFKGFNMDTTSNPGCIKVQGGMDQFILLIFKVFIGFCSVLAVIFIATAGISMIVEEANIQKKIKAKDMLMRALQGLLLSLVAWILLFTLNKRLVEFNVDDVFTATKFQSTIAAGLANTPNFNIIQAGNSVQNFLQPPVGTGGVTGTGGGGMNNGTAGANQYAGTLDANGATAVTEATIFGYMDGNGRTGDFGDNGIGGSALSHIPGRTNYTGDTRSVGVAVPTSWIQRDFGSYRNAVNGAYAIYKDGVHKGNFPIVDVSKSKLDFTYGMVIANFDANIQRNRSNTDWAWSGTGISYKALPNFWLSNPRPANPMIEYKRINGTSESGYGIWLISEVLPADVINAIQQGNVNVIMQ